jgi:GntR family transcriptional repressor for pyruvate dehydrogenase complex
MGGYRSDLPVHRAIARAARNPILADALEEALKYTESSPWADLRACALASPTAREGHIRRSAT